MTEPGRPTIVMKFVNTIVEDIVRIVMGLVAMGGGFWAVAYEAKHPPANNIILLAGLVFSVMGFCLMPYVFPQVQKIFIFILPDGVDVPMVGHLGRRKGDKPQAIDEPPPERGP